MDNVKPGLKILLSLIMVFAGIMHFAKPGPFVKIVPRYLPAPLALVYISGFFEIAGGAGLLVPATSRMAAWGLVALFIAVFPANINMAVHNIPMGKNPVPSYANWLRLPFQAVLIAWAAWYAVE